MNIDNGMESDPSKCRYIGSSFHFNDLGNIATCSHVVNSLSEDESVVGIEMHGDCLAYIVEDIRCKLW